MFTMFLVPTAKREQNATVYTGFWILLLIKKGLWI